MAPSCCDVSVCINAIVGDVAGLHHQIVGGYLVVMAWHLVHSSAGYTSRVVHGAGRDHHILGCRGVQHHAWRRGPVIICR